MIVSIIGYVAGAITFLAYVLYARSILNGKSRPSRSTWFIWTVLTFLIALSYSLTGADDTLWSAYGAAVGTLAIFLLSIKYGVGGWEKIDKFVLVGAVLGIGLWYYSGSAFIALLAYLTADLMGAIPTAVKTYVSPWEEEWFPWFVTVFANVLNVLALDVTAIGQWELDVAVYPFYMVVINGLILFFILRPKLGGVVDSMSR
jgi:hypothetical protein